jgi:hypothetical protein
MRQFRAWIMPYEMMVEVQRINFDVQTVEVQIGEGDLYEFDFEEIELMRSTGLKDKNGVEIYEGDILHRESHWGWYVGFENGSFRRIPLNCIQRINWEHYTLQQAGLDTWEVIGNIHENPELLEV